jgi:16S rRNA (guanine527-N7)-methyltransferase
MFFRSMGLDPGTTSDAFRTGEAVGRVFGLVAIFVIVVAGIRKCLEIARRPTANAKGAWSLALGLGTWAAASALDAIRVLAGLGPWTMLIWVVMFGSAIATGLLAVQALVEIRRAPEKYAQGRGQAIGALVLGGVLVGAGIVGVVSGVSRASSIPAEWAGDPHPPGEKLVVADQNFTFDAPEKPWTTLDAKKLNPQATLAFARSNPPVYLMIIAETTPTLTARSEMVAEVTKANVRSAAERAVLVAERPHDVHALPGVWIEMNAELKTGPLAYVAWVLADRGHLHQLLVWGAAKDADEVRAAATMLVDRFDVIDKPDDEPDAALPVRPAAKTISLSVRGTKLAMAAAIAPLGTGWDPLVERAASALSSPIVASTTERLRAWLDAVASWNARIDLTAARGADELVDLMLADAIVLGASLEPGTRLVDVGAGAGAPGLGIAILRPDVTVTLVEPLQKRVAFLRTVVGTLALATSVVRDRGEQLVSRAATFDVAVARATLPPPEWLALGAKLAPTGSVWVLLAREAPPSLAGWSIAEDRAYRWPLTGVERRAVRYRASA